MVVTVFAAIPLPGAPLSPFAQSLHERWGHQADAAVTRQREDLAALACLGAEAVHWHYADCIYRRTPDGQFPYDSEESLWAEIHPAEEGLIAELAARLAALPLGTRGALYVPLGLGHHVDHRIVNCAANRAACRLVHYEDFPYAEDLQEVEAALESAQWQINLTMVSEAALQAKIAAVGCYESQISTFWSGREEMAVRVRAFAERIGAGRPAERYWTGT
jgi:LmbE family N-acetylglucosaminyl deacetylase